MLNDKVVASDDPHAHNDVVKPAPMSRPLQLLSIEDSEDDFLLQIEALKEYGFDPCSTRVESKEELTAALDSNWDLILSDFTLPRFDGRAALELVRQRNPDLPFVVVSGTVGEEIAADLMRAGANDYVLKTKLWRLGLVIDRELRDAETRRARSTAEAALRENDRKYRSVIEQASEGIVIMDRDGAFLEANRSALARAGYSEAELRAASVMDLVDPDDVRATPLAYNLLSPGESVMTRRLLRRKDGSRFFADISTTALDDGRALLIVRDVTAQVETEAALRRREAQQRAIADLGHMIAGPADRGALLNHAAHLIVETLSFEYCRISECGPDGCSVRARVGCPSGPVDTTCTVTAEYIRTVIASREPVPFDPADRGMVEACTEDEGIVAGFSLGIGTAERPIAVVDVCSRSRHTLDEDERGFLNSVRSILASAIEHRRSEEALRRSEERLATAQRIANLGSWEMNLESGLCVWSLQTFRMMGLPPSDPPP